MKPSRDLSLYRRGTVAIVKVFLENLKYRTRRDSDLDPWSMRDNYRMNHMPMRELIMVKNEDEEQDHMWVQYINEHTFNVYSKDEDGFLTPVILDAECYVSDDKPDQLVVRNDHHTYLVDYYMDPKEHNVVSQLDYEGAPLSIKVKKTKLEKVFDEEDPNAAIQDNVKSPMPGTVVKVNVKVGD